MQTSYCHRVVSLARPSLPKTRHATKVFRPFTNGKSRFLRHSEPDRTGDVALLSAAGLLLPLLANVEPAIAGDPLLTGKTVSLLHPAMMLFLFGASGWTAYLGFQWKRTREIPALVKEMKAQLPKAAEDGTRPPSPLDADIAALEEERKKLLKGDYRTEHWNWGSLLLGLGVLIAIEGPVNTYLRTGKLFPGPHLYAGAGIVVLWGLAASLVPAMAKGSEAARAAHITLNCINLLLFAWQVPTGFDIVQKVWENVPWP